MSGASAFAQLRGKHYEPQFAELPLLHLWLVCPSRPFVVQLLLIRHAASALLLRDIDTTSRQLAWEEKYPTLQRSLLFARICPSFGWRTQRVLWLALAQEISLVFLIDRALSK